MLNKIFSFFKKYWIEILIILLFCVISCFCFKISNTYGSESSNELNNLVEILFNSLVALITIWFSAYFILIQLYKNTYPMEVIEKNFIKKVKNILIFAICTILLGIIILSGVKNNIINYYFISLFLANLGLIIVNTYMVNRSLTINTYVDNYFKKLSKNLKNKKLNKKMIDENFKSLQKFFNECIIKDEYSVCNNISDKMGSFFRELIEECNQMLLNGNGDLAGYIFDNIINYSIAQIRMAKLSKIPTFYKELINQQVENILVCVNIGNFDLFKKYLVKVNLLLKDYNQNKKYAEEICTVNIRIVESILKKEKNWIENFLDELFNFGITFFDLENDIYISSLGKVITWALIKNEEYENENSKYDSKYDILKNFLTKYSILLSNVSEKEMQEICLYYSLYGIKILKEKELERVKEFIEIVTNEIDARVDSEKWNTFILFYLKKSLEQWENELGEANREKIINYVIRMNLNEINTNFSEILPDYNKLIKDNIFNNEILEKIINDIDELFFRLLYNNLDVTLRNFFESINDIIKETESELVRKKLLELDIELIKRCEKDKKDLYGYFIFSFNEILEKLDKERKINKELGTQIIDKLCCIGEETSDEEKIIKIVNLIDDILNDEDYVYFFVTSKLIDRKYICKRLYNVGSNCIEINMIEGLRHISNLLGWEIIRCLNGDDRTSAIYILKRAYDLYEFSKIMKLPDNILIYLLTLFTTIGTYCCKDPKFLNALNLIIMFLKKEEKEYIIAAIDLRTKENDLWNDLYEMQTGKLTKIFKDKILCAIQNKEKNKQKLSNN